ncbi:hypothetical protein HBO12_25710 [Pseudomonas sp. WS 5059]|uniref:hypothetical protein n=1 Tax=Pseudomonas sp. WS 5059 TaxID=2717491 RepID=UPI001473B7B6|nr:hypothetical protein [Pseudomonas sp. WS 5059]NMY06357.1 hypothetical protein [Pseudomonas sp. WS 5059]
MTNVIDFPPVQPMETIDQAYFEKYTDAALILKCFEVVKDAIEFINEDGVFHIHMQDDTHVNFIEAFWALKVLFHRETGADAIKVSEDHLEAMRRHLFDGVDLPQMSIPVASAGFDPLPPEAFEYRSDLELVRSGLNYATKVQETLLKVSPGALDMATARVFAIDATTAMHVLKQRLAGYAPGDASAAVIRTTASGETLQ